MPMEHRKLQQLILDLELQEPEFVFHTPETLMCTLQLTIRLIHQRGPLVRLPDLQKSQKLGLVVVALALLIHPQLTTFQFLLIPILGLAPLLFLDR